jgi:hypothetical protein
MTCRGRAPSSHPRARVVVGGSAKQTSGRYFWRRCGRMRASPRWLEYSNTYYLFRSALPHAERRVLSRSPSTPKSDVFRPALLHRERPDRQLLPFQSVCFDPRSRTGGDGSAREYSNTYNPRSRTGATAVVKGYAMDASMTAFFWCRGRLSRLPRPKVAFPWCYSMAVISAWSLPARTLSPTRFPSSSPGQRRDVRDRALHGVRLVLAHDPEGCRRPSYPEVHLELCAESGPMIDSCGRVRCGPRGP